MGKIMLSGYLPGQDHQGVSDQFEALMDDDGLDLIVVGVIEQSTLVAGRGHNSGKEPTLNLRWRSIEVAKTPGAAEKVMAILGELRSDRIGQLELDGEAAASEAEAVAQVQQAPDAPAKTRKRASRRGNLAAAPAV